MKTIITTLISILIINSTAIAQDSVCVTEDDSVNIFLLMGLTRQSALWSPVFLENLKKNIPNARIFFLDLPGSGKYVNDKACLSVKGMIDFMRPEVLETMKANKGKNIICATSLGGMVACEWTISYKNDFQGLIMINSSFKDICTQKERAKPSARKTMFKILISKSVEVREKLTITINSNKPSTFDSIAKINTQIQNEKKMTRGNIFRQTIAGMRYSPNGNKPGVPLLIVGSKADQVVCQECIQKTYDEFGGTLAWNDTAGHSLPTDEPTWLSEQIANWANFQFEQELLVKEQNELLQLNAMAQTTK